MKNISQYNINEEVELYRSIIEHSADSMFVIDKDKVVIGALNVSTDMTNGGAVEDILGNSILTYANDPSSPFYEACKMLSANFDYVFETGIPTKFNYMIGDRHLESTITKISGDRIVSRARDITEVVSNQYNIEKKKIKELTMVLKAGGLTAWQYDVKNRKIFSKQNKGALSSGVSIDDFIVPILPEYRQIMISMLDDIVNKRSVYSYITIQVTCKDKENKWYDIHAIPYEYSQDGDVIEIVGSYKDVSQYVSDENYRDELLRQNSLIMNNSNVGFVYISPDYRVVWENVSLVFDDPQIWHYREGRCCYESFAITEPCKKCVMRRAMESRQAQYAEYTTKSGKIIEIMGNPVIGNNNQITGVILRLRDVTELKGYIRQIEDSELRRSASNDLLMAVIDSLPCSLFIKDASNDYKYVMANKLFCLQAFPSVDKITDKTDYDIFVKEEADRFRRDDVRIVEQGGTHIIQEEDVPFGDEMRVWYTIKTSMLTADENKKLLIGVGLDITERVKEQKQLADSKTLLELTFSAGSVTPWEIDMTTKQILSNSPNSVFSRIKMTYIEFVNNFVHIDDKNRFRVDCDNFFDGIIDTIDSKIRAYREGKYEWVHVVGKTIIDPKTGLPKGVGTVWIITEEVQKQEELDKARKRAEQSDALKSAFLANMSHEIRTPLNALVGFSQMISEAEEEDRDVYLSIIKNNSELLLNLINDILDLSKIEAGYVDYVNTRFDITALFQEIEIMIAPKVSRGVVFVNVSKDEKCFVNLDRFRISQIITNFLTNAIKFTTNGSIEMGYELDGYGIKIYVRDTGCGISDENQLKVFERFEKFNAFIQGTGLGMSICKAITDAYKGDIGVSSVLGEGSYFWAWLPTPIFVDDDTDDQYDALKIKTPNNKVFKNSRSLNVLIAEDNDFNYALLEVMLKNHSVERAVNGVEAVEKVRDGNFDFVLMDIQMPVMDGLDAAKMIREFNRKIRIIAVTANVFEIDRKSAMDCGCNAFLTKPVERATLIEMLESEVNK